MTQPKYSYGASTRYGADDEFTLEVTGWCSRVYLTLDEDDPNEPFEDLVLDLGQAESLGRMLLKAAGAERKARSKRIEEARKAVA